MAKDKKTLGDVLRQAVWESELTDYRIAKIAGIGPEPMIAGSTPALA